MSIVVRRLLFTFAGVLGSLLVPGVQEARAQAVVTGTCDGSVTAGQAINYSGSVTGLTPGYPYYVKINLYNSGNAVKQTVTYRIIADINGNASFNSGVPDAIGTPIALLKLVAYDPGTSKDAGKVGFQVFSGAPGGVGGAVTNEVKDDCEVGPNR